MTQDVALRLAELVRERHDGRISVADYRKLRAPLLDRLVIHADGGEDESSLITRPRATMRVAGPAPTPEPVPVSAPVAADLESVFGPRPRIAPWMLWAFIAASVLIVAVGTFYPKQDGESAEIEPVRVSSVPTTVEMPAADDAAQPARKTESRSGSERKATARPAAKTSPCQPARSGASAATCEDRLSGRESGPSLVVVGSFAISARAVSQSQFRAFCEKTGRSFPRQPWDDDDDAVVNVTWREANDYLEWLSTETGQRYRLPTEAEWLEATRALDTRGGFSAGNVREWVQDAWKAEGGSAAGADQRVVRGTSYADDTTTLLSARRNRDPGIRDALTGFRALREMP